MDARQKELRMMSKSGWNYDKASRDRAGNLFDTLRGHTRSF